MDTFQGKARSLLRKTPSLIRRALFLTSLEDTSYEKREEMWPPARKLESKHIRNCRFIEDRYVLMDLMPKNAVCGEIGIWHCDFSQHILDTTRPAVLHLFDINEEFTNTALSRFAGEIASGTVEVHLGDSAQELRKLPDNCLDWIYIDGDHSYEGVKRDLESVREKIRPDGLIALNDYVSFSIYELMKYGVIEAVNEFCLEHDFELVYYALNEYSYNDVVIRRIN